MDAGQIQFQRPQKWLARNEANQRRDIPQVPNSKRGILVFHRRSNPDMPRNSGRRKQVHVPFHESAGASRSFRENLVDMVIHFEHDLENLPDERRFHGLVEEVAHGVDKYAPRFMPDRRLAEALRPDADSEGIESVLYRVHHRKPTSVDIPQESVRQILGIAEITATADLRTTGDRIPGRIRPLNPSLDAQESPYRIETEINESKVGIPSGIPQAAQPLVWHAEAALIDMKLALADGLRDLRSKRRLTQAEVARFIGSSQSRVAKIEAADSSVSMDLLVRTLLRLGATPETVAQLVSGNSRSGAA